MTIFGLNSPEIFIILVIFLLILGPKRIEKLLNSFPGFIKFLLNDEKNYKNVIEEKELEAPVIEEKEAKAPVIEEKEVKAPVIEEKELEAPVIEEKEAKAPVIEEKEVKAPVIEEKEAKAPVIEEKELEDSKNKDKVTKTMNAKSINLDGENKVNSNRSVKTKEKTPKSNKKTQAKKDKDSENIK